MKNTFTIIFASIAAILLFIPVTPIVLRILYYAEFAFGFIILEICIFCIFKKSYPKKIPKVLPPLLVYFCIYTLAVKVSTVKAILTMGVSQKEIPLITKYVEGGFQSFPYAGYIVFVLFVILVFVLLYRKFDVENENLDKSKKFMKGTLKALFLMFIVSFGGGTLTGIFNNNLGIKESLFLYLSYSCAELSFFLLCFNLVCLGVDTLLSVIQSKTKFFSTL